MRKKVRVDGQDTPDIFHPVKSKRIGFQDLVRDVQKSAQLTRIQCKQATTRKTELNKLSKHSVGYSNPRTREDR